MTTIKSIVMSERELNLLVDLLNILVEDMMAARKPELAALFKHIIHMLHPQDVVPMQA